jgi:outer membrane lipoprotein-sorting protein
MGGFTNEKATLPLALIIAALAVCWFPAGSRAQTCAELGPRELLDRVDDVYRGKSSHGEMTMKVVTRHWSRQLTMEVWSKGDKRSLVRILSPLKEKGTATLMVDNNIWNFLPKVQRVIKIPSSMMGSSWMGSHFTNDDLIKKNRMAEDFTFRKTFAGKREGRSLIEITLVPRPEAAIVWGKVVVEVDVETCLPRRELFYDEDTKLARTMVFSDVRQVNGRRLPLAVKVYPADKPGEFTEVRYDEIEFDVAADDAIFSLRNLQR